MTGGSSTLIDTVRRQRSPRPCITGDWASAAINAANGLSSAPHRRAPTSQAGVDCRGDAGSAGLLLWWWMRSRHRRRHKADVDRPPSAWTRPTSGRWRPCRWRLDELSKQMVGRRRQRGPHLRRARLQAGGRGVRRRADQTLRRRRSDCQSRSGTSRSGAQTLDDASPERLPEQRRLLTSVKWWRPAGPTTSWSRKQGVPRVAGPDHQRSRPPP